MQCVTSKGRRADRFAGLSFYSGCCALSSCVRSWMENRKPYIYIFWTQFGEWNTLNQVRSATANKGCRLCIYNRSHKIPQLPEPNHKVSTSLIRYFLDTLELFQRHDLIKYNVQPYHPAHYAPSRKFSSLASTVTSPSSWWARSLWGFRDSPVLVQIRAVHTLSHQAQATGKLG